MDNQLMWFHFDGEGIRVVVHDGEPWWVAKDVCDVLGHSDTSMSLKRLDDDEKLTQTLFVSGQNRDVWLISESGLYNLVLTSRKPEAKAFKRWITHEVIPTLRKTGSYSVVPQHQIPQTYAEALRLAADQAEEIERQKATIAIMEPKVEFYEAVASSEDGMSVGDVAKAIGTGRNRLFEWLRKERILMRDSANKNRPYQEYIERGYMKVIVQTWSDLTGETHTNFKPLFTGKGLTWIQKMWRKGQNAHAG